MSIEQKSMVTKQLNQMSIDSKSSPKTPKDDVFDLFAPGLDDNMPRSAPHNNKYNKEIRNIVVLRFNFHPPPPHPQEQLIVSGQDIFASMHQNLVQFVVSKQAEEAQLIDDNTDTCPGAPLNHHG